MSHISDYASASIALDATSSLARSALPDAPIVPDEPRASLVDRARRAIAAGRRLVYRPTPALKHPAMTQG